MSRECKIRAAKGNKCWPGNKSKAPIAAKALLMNDLIFAGAMILFFVVSALYVRFCDKL
jgi:hypothetical protein